MSEKEEEVTMEDRRIQHIASTIRVVPDFPKPGTLFLSVCQFADTYLLGPKNAIVRRDHVSRHNNTSSRSKGLQTHLGLVRGAIHRQEHHCGCR